MKVEISETESNFLSALLKLSKSFLIKWEENETHWIVYTPISNKKAGNIVSKMNECGFIYTGFGELKQETWMFIKEK